MEAVRVIDRSGPRRLTWVGGDDAYLRERLIDKIKERMAVSSINYVSLSAREGRKEVWAALNAYPLDATGRGRYRLVLVRDADLLLTTGKNGQRLRGLLDWLGDAPPQTVAVFDCRGQWRKEKTGGKWVHVEEAARTAMVKAYTSLVVDVSLTDIEDRVTRDTKTHKRIYKTSDSVLITQSWMDISKDDAIFLLKRVDKNMRVVADTATWARAVLGPGSRVTNRFIEWATQPSDSQEYVRALLRGDRATAVTAARGIDVGGYAPVIGKVTAALSVLEVLHSAKHRGLSSWRAGQEESVPPQVVDRLWDIAGQYDEKRAALCWEKLAAVDTGKSWQTQGALELLALIW